MAVVTLPEPYRPAGTWQWSDGPARSFRTVVRLLRQPGRGGTLGLTLLGMALAFLVIARFAAGAAAPAPDALAATLPRRWVDIVRPSPVFALNSPEFGKQPSVYEARRRTSGDGRQDMLTFGRFDGGATPYLYLSLYRIGSQTAPSAAFFVELARRAAEVALAVTRSDQPAPLSTRLGDFETADVVLARGAAQAACLGFRLDVERQGFIVAGFACGGAGKRLERTILGCTLDRLDLVSAGVGRDLAQFFATARTKRGRSCSDRLMPAPSARQDSSQTARRLPKGTELTKMTSR